MRERLSLVSDAREFREPSWSVLETRELLPATADAAAPFSDWLSPLMLLPSNTVLEVAHGFSPPDGRLRSQLSLLGRSESVLPAEPGRLLQFIAESITPAAAVGGVVDPRCVAELHQVIPDAFDWCSRAVSSSSGHARSPSASLLLFSPPSAWPWHLDRALRALASSGLARGLVVRVRPVEAAPSLKSALVAINGRVLEARGVFGSNPFVDQAARDSRTLLSASRHYELTVHLDAPIVDPLDVAMVSLSLFGTEPGRRAPADAVDLRGLVAEGTVPGALLPSVAATTLRKLRGAAELSSGDLSIGQLTDGADALIRATDRLRHIYVLGGTGTGKSSLMRRMIKQDADSGHAVILLDPHGDLAGEVADDLRGEPRTRLVDAGTASGGFALDLLAMIRNPDTRDQGFDTFMEVLQKLLYADVDAFGPMFDQYFRNALLLLALGGSPAEGLADLPRIFTDRDLRKQMLERAGVHELHHFWRRIAPATTGDQSLDNFTPYITSKLTRFIGSPAARRIFSPEGSGLDFAAEIGASHVLLLRIPKGEIGEGVSRLAAAVALQQIAHAIMARPRAMRTPVRLYVDEMQSCPGTTLSMLLAEGRKFGVALTLANQSLGQVGGGAASLANAVLANVGNLLLFRLGAPDAIRISPWMEDPDSWRALCRLPDFHLKARILDNGRPVVLPLVRTLPPDPPVSTQGRP